MAIVAMGRLRHSAMKLGHEKKQLQPGGQRWRKINPPGLKGALYDVDTGPNPLGPSSTLRNRVQLKLPSSPS